MEKDHLFENIFFLSVLILIGIGIVMVYSSSTLIALKKYDDGYYFLKKQAIFAFVGISLLIFFMYCDYHIFRNKFYLYPILGISLLLLILVFVPGIGVKVNHANRWVNIFGYCFQPSELAKLILIIYLAYSLEKKERYIESFSKGFLFHIFISGLFFFLILIEPDFGAAVMILILTLILLFIAGVRKFYLVSSVTAGILLLVILILGSGYRLKRIFAFIDPWSDPKGAGYHIIQSFIAFGSGGLWGRGLGNGRQKLFYLPEPHTDYILSVIGEELGLIGVFIILCLFFFLLNSGVMIALRAKDRLGTYLALGITSLIIIEAVINMGVVLGVVPPKGITLPFISYGGSSLIIKLIGVGIMLNIASHERRL